MGVLDPAERRFTADEAIRMAEAGILRDDEHFELLDGAFVDSDPATGEEIKRRFTGEEAIRLVEVGIIGDDEPVQLLDGAFVEMSPQSAQHSAAVRRLADRLRRAYGARANVFEEKPLATSVHDLPEPGLSVVRPRGDDYSTSHPTGQDAILVIEVAWSSQRTDRLKSSIYAAGGVAVYWLLDLAARKLEVMTAPQGHIYEGCRVVSEDEEVDLPETSERWLVRDLLLPR
jgi:Uma2 family endonuclease